MSSPPRSPPIGLPSSPRPTLTPLTTTFPPRTYQPSSPFSTTSSTTTLVAPSRSPSSLIFINATIPLSPSSTSSTSSANFSPHKSNPYDGLQPKRRNGFARLFSCLGRRERARRRGEREVQEFEKVGGGGHWSEW
ncbi:hypothetical protein NX059_002861 [Plenodomus lindquistii]|nr:hypothetical protein NX059_002861 [Plenodomus lindquistii]